MLAEYNSFILFFYGWAYTVCIVRNVFLLWACLCVFMCYVWKYCVPYLCKTCNAVHLRKNSDLLPNTFRMQSVRVCVCMSVYSYHMVCRQDSTASLCHLLGEAALVPSHTLSLCAHIHTCTHTYAAEQSLRVIFLLCPCWDMLARSLCMCVGVCVCVYSLHSTDINIEAHTELLAIKLCY